MKTWKDITLYQFQQMELISKRIDLSDLDKSLFQLCVAFDKTETQLDRLKIKKVKRLSDRLKKVMANPIKNIPKKRIGKYFINYQPETMRFGQYVELNAFLIDKDRIYQNAHFILASISNRLWRSNNSNDHAKKSEYFLNAPITKVIGVINRFTENFLQFNKSYDSLFDKPGPEDGVQTDNVHPFNRRFGWIYSATKVADHERITLDQSFDLPVVQALNDLAFLKSHDEYMKEKIKTK